jgi:hypothetical protein
MSQTLTITIQGEDGETLLSTSIDIAPEKAGAVIRAVSATLDAFAVEE